MAKVVEMEGLTKVYKAALGTRPVRALNNISLSIEEGETFGLVGPNGSGKTTAIKILIGLLFPTSGSAWLFGQRVVDPEVKQRIGFVPEGTYFYDWLSGEELLDFYASLHGMGKRERASRIDELLTAVGMQERRKMHLRYYSRGMLQRIGLAQALLGDPELLILDEPTSGLDPVGAYEIRKMLMQLKAQGKTIFLCSHLLNEVEAMCDRVTILHRGNIVAEGKVEELLPPEKEMEIVVTDLEEGAIAEIQGLGASLSADNGTKRFRTVDDQVVRQIVDLVSDRGGRLLEVRRHRPTLEEFFMEKVKEEA